MSTLLLLVAMVISLVRAVTTMTKPVKRLVEVMMSKVMVIEVPAWVTLLVEVGGVQLHHSRLLENWFRQLGLLGLDSFR